jgi:hypothetical protein
MTRSSFLHYPLTIPSLSPPYPLTIPSLSPHYSLTIPSLFPHYPLTIPSKGRQYNVSLHFPFLVVWLKCVEECLFSLTFLSLWSDWNVFTHSSQFPIFHISAISPSCSLSFFSARVLHMMANAELLRNHKYANTLSDLEGDCKIF